MDRANVNMQMEQYINNLILLMVIKKAKKLHILKVNYIKNVIIKIINYMVNI